MPGENIGWIKWEAVEVATGEVLGAGEKDVVESDVSIAVNNNPDLLLHSKTVPLDESFFFTACDTPNEQAPTGFGLHVMKTGLPCFSWDWFHVDRPGHGFKIQESGEIEFERERTPLGHETRRMTFLTDVSMRAYLITDAIDPLNPIWRVKIFKGSWMCWPSLGKREQDG